MRTGIVCTLDQRKAVILQADGSFVSVRANPHWKVGDVVPVPSANQNRHTALRTCVASLAILVLGGLMGGWLYFTPVAVISVDVNPSIEFSVNRFDRVISTTSLNDEGSQILSDTKIKNRAYQAAVGTILSAERVDGYFDGEANVVLTVFSANSTRQSTVLSELKEVVNTEAAHYADQLTAEYHAVDQAILDGAHGHGVSAGKYLYLQQLQTLAPETDLTTYTHHSIEQLKGEIEACKKEHENDPAPPPHAETHKEENCT